MLIKRQKTIQHFRHGSVREQIKLKDAYKIYKDFLFPALPMAGSAKQLSVNRVLVLDHAGSLPTKETCNDLGMGPRKRECILYL